MARHTLQVFGQVFGLMVIVWGLGCKDPSRSGEGPVRPRQPGATEQSFAGLDKGKIAAGQERPAGGPDAAPMNLTASDGTGLRLVRLASRAALQGPLALTELHLVFQNPEPRQLEGRFTITLPEGAAVSRFAMLLPQGWQEAEVVERQAARRAYEDALHRRQDPALLEKEAGNQFSARIFPIPANGTKEIILAYSQELASRAAPYRLLLRGLPVLEQLDIEVVLGEKKAPIRVARKRFVPDQDFEVPAAAFGADVSGLRSGNLVLARLRPQINDKPAPLQGLLILFDTSASRAAGFGRQVAGLSALIQEISRSAGAATPIGVACFDQALGMVYQGPAGQFGAKHAAEILQRRALGASDLGAALSALRGRAGFGRMLVLSDGVITAGPSGAALAQAVAALRPQIERLDVALSGGIRDTAAMRALTTGNLAQDGVVLDGDGDAAELVRRLGKAALSGVKVAVSGAPWSWPAQLDGYQVGDEVLVYAELGAEGAAAPPEGQPLTVSLSGQINHTETVALQPVTRPLLERAWVKARIASLTKQSEATADKDLAGAMRKQILELSTRHRVLSDLTALLVLETEADYQRFQIDRNALADILTVGPTGPTLMHRNQPVLAIAVPPPAPPPPPRERVRSNFGWRGSGIGGGGAAPAAVLRNKATDEGGVPGGVFGGAPEKPEAKMEAREEDARPGSAAAAAPAVAMPPPSPAPAAEPPQPPADRFAADPLAAEKLAEAPKRMAPLRRMAPPVDAGPAPSAQVVLGEPEVQGALSADLVRRILRGISPRIRQCYESGLARNPRLQGQVTVRFTIDAEGRVPRSDVHSTTLSDAAVANCVAQSVRAATFPRSAGSVIVTYPFAFRTTGHGGRLWRTPAALRKRGPGDVDYSTWGQGNAPSYTGRVAEIFGRIEAGQVDEALSDAMAWQAEQPADVMALMALGESLEAAKRPALAARAYGSLIDLFPSRADLRRYAGVRLQALGADGLELALDTFRKAQEQRPDHPNSHRLVAYAAARLGQFDQAMGAMEKGLAQPYPGGRFLGVYRIMQEDLGLFAAALLRREPARLPEVRTRLERFTVALPREPSLRFLMSWETDANDVDFHIHDGQGGHAYYSQRQLPSGGELYADVTTGYGPECFAIPGKARAFPYRLEAHYYSRGPMGYGMGAVMVVQHDGHGVLRFEDRPFVVMNDHAYVDLGVVEGALR